MIFRLSLNVKKHDDYQESIRWLLGWIEEYGRTIAKHGKDSHQTLTLVRHLR
jgi:hypothetical protein